MKRLFKAYHSRRMNKCCGMNGHISDDGRTGLEIGFRTGPGTGFFFFAISVRNSRLVLS
jgi:hypothetical protein